MNKVWFITGAARGMGKAIAEAALQVGDCVVATTRKPDDFQIPEGCADRVLSLQLDVANTDQSIFDAAVRQAVEKFGRIDVLVNNAGYGSVTFFEETDEEAIKQQFEVNDACRWQDGFIANLDPKGDPEKLAQVILEVANADTPPLHLPIGEDAPAVLEAYAEQLKADADTWREK